MIILSILDTFEDLGLVTFEIFAQSDDKTWPDQQKVYDNDNDSGKYK